MLWEDEERERDVANIVKTIVPPVGARATYYPGENGMERDLSQPAGEAPTSKATMTPTVSQVNTGAPYGRLSVAGQEYRMPAAAITEAVTGAGQTPSAPKYGIPPEMLSRFDDVVKAITGPSPESDILKMQAQGFGLGLPPGRRRGAGPSPQMEASKALAQIEGMRRQAASHIAQSLANLMMDPNRFAAGVFKTQTDLASEQEKNRLLERKMAVEEARLPLEQRKAAIQAPETVSGYGPGGERILYGWNPEKQTWDTMTKGAIPVELAREGKLVDPTSGKILAEGGQGSKFREGLGQLAFKEYINEMKAIENDLTLQGEDEKSKKKKTERQQEAYGRLQSMMDRLGHGQMFEEENISNSMENQIYKGQHGNYIFKNGKWELYKG